MEGASVTAPSLPSPLDELDPDQSAALAGHLAYLPRAAAAWARAADDALNV